MILIDIPFPESCYDCPCSHWITGGRHEGELMCNAIEFRDRCEAGKCIADNVKDRRADCPIKWEII